MFSTIVLTVVFLAYLLFNPQKEFMSVPAWIYYFFACFSHAGLLCLIVSLVFYLIPSLLRIPLKGCLLIAAVGYSLMDVMGVVNYFVYSLYRFHINGVIVSMMIGGGGDIFVFDFAVWLKAVLGVAVILLLNVVIAYLSVRLSDKFAIVKSVSASIVD